MKRIALVVAVSLTLVACGDDETVAEDPIDVILGLDGNATKGEIVYATCAASNCHGQDGASGDPNSPDLADAVPDLDERGLVETVKNGTGTMPGQALSDQEIADVAAYTRQTFP